METLLLECAAFQSPPGECRLKKNLSCNLFLCCHEMMKSWDNCYICQEVSEHENELTVGQMIPSNLPPAFR